MSRNNVLKPFHANSIFVSEICHILFEYGSKMILCHINETKIIRKWFNYRDRSEGEVKIVPPSFMYLRNIQSIQRKSKALQMQDKKDYLKINCRTDSREEAVK